MGYSNERLVGEPDCDVIVSAAHRYMIRCETPAVGLHPSLLPAYRGSYPLWWALKAREAWVGLTAFRLDPGIDTGNVLAQVAVPVARGDTFAGLYARVADRVPQVLAEALSGDLMGTPQPPGDWAVYRTPPRWQRALYRAWWALG